jgi:hypothetical protein
MAPVVGALLHIKPASAQEFNSLVSKLNACVVCKIPEFK